MRIFQITPCLLLALVTAGIAPGGVAHSGTLEDVLDRGYVRCAIGNRPVGDTRIGATGYEGFFPEFCRVIALALFNDRNAVQLAPTLIRHGLQSISEGDVDVYVSNVTWTFSRDFALNLTPAAVLYHDGQGFLSHAGQIDGPLREVQRASVCVSRSTTTIGNLEDFVAINGLDWEIVAFESSEGRNDAFFAHQCDLVTTDRLVLATMRTTAVDSPDNYVLHDEIISEEPLVAYVSADDMEWGNFVRWTILVTILAEQMGVSTDNYESLLSDPDPAVRRLLGTEPTLGTEELGLSPEWARNIIAGAGNYGEIFDRYLGRASGIGLDRGANELRTRGGLMFSAPFR